MANKMLIDATHPEETRVVVVRGNRVEEFDYEAASRKQLRGNIYLAKVTRVEPSLQAAFIEYGGNRHGFLAFSEIHPDYYQIPVADRLALIEEEERAARQADEEDERRERRRDRSRPRAARNEGSEESVSGNVEEIEDSDVVETIEDGQISGSPEDETEDTIAEEAVAEDTAAEEDDAPATGEEGLPAPQEQAAVISEGALAAEAPAAERERAPILPEDATSEDAASEDASPEDAPEGEAGMSSADSSESEDDDEDEDEQEEDEGVEQMGSDDAMEEVPERARQRRARSYKIQEVIRRRQVMLVQVVKEERGNKGAALTTYLSLAGRYSVLMPNTARGGGISRKITNAVDRKRLKEVVQDLEVPEGMGVILRTAGANRTKVEIKRDFEYLLRLWETVRELTLGSSAPSLVYEEGSLIKRAIRDLYNKDIDDIYVAGEEGYREARDFMRMLMPSHAKNVIAYRDPQPIFAKHGVEHQLDAMFSPVVQLKSGGYIVINPTEALVSIDVNSGRATREHHIEDTALKTNLEASEEIARQLRLRDLAGLIVIDFIDMEEKRNNRSVERKLKDCLKNDRARIQVGRISHFGLMEMSRQRIRTGVLESSIEVCPVCGGTGHVRSAASVALQLLRALEEQLLRSASHNLVARTRGEVALYVLNHKRAHLRELEERFSVTLTVNADESVTGHHPFIIEKGEPAAPAPAAPRPGKVVQPDSILPEEAYEEEDEEENLEEAEAAEAEGDENGERSEENGTRRRRRRRRRRSGDRDGDDREVRAESEAPAETADETRPAEAAAAETENGPVVAEADADADAEGEDEDERNDDGRSESDRRRRRRGRRGGRRNRRDEDAATVEGESDEAVAAAPSVESAEFTPAESTSSEPPAEPGVPVEPAEAAAAPEPAATVAEPEAAPPAESVSAAESVPTADSAPAAEPAPAAQEEPVAAAPARAPRRRSTVREKAPTAGAASAPAAEAAAPAPTPVSSVVEVAGEDASMPIADADIKAGTSGAPLPETAPVAAEEEPAPAVESQSEPASESPPTAPAEGEAGSAKPRSGWWQRRLSRA